VRTGKRIRLSNSNNVFGRERVSVEEAFPGDVIGIVGGDQLCIGDTLSEDPSIAYSEIPRFPPECFSYIYNPIPSNYKRFANGLEQLVQEGLVHQYQIAGAAVKMPLLAAVGPLQFDLVQFRLESEYQAPARLEKTAWTLARWIKEGPTQRSELRLPTGTDVAEDRNGKTVVLFPGEWHLTYFQENNKSVVLSEYGS